MRDTTTITLTRHTYKNLRKITRKGETFDKAVNFLLNLYHYIYKTNETNRQEIEEILKED